MVDRADSDAGRDVWEWDPEFLAARRDAWKILAFFVVALAWVIPSAMWLGYDGAAFGPAPQGDTATTTMLGFPTWVVWSVALPWLVADVAILWFCWRRIAGKDAGHTARKES